MIIREMNAQDWVAVARIYGEALEKGLATFQTTVPSWEEWDRAHIAQCRLAAEEAGVLLGWIALSHVSARAVYKGVAEVSVYVAGTAQGKGVGKALLQALIVRSEQAGFWSLLAVIHRINEASQRLFKSCGFREIGYRERIAQDKFGRWLDTLMFERRSAIVGTN